MRISKLVLQASCLQTLKEFYSSVLELQVEIISEKEIAVKIGSSTLIFVGTIKSEPFYHFAINIPSNKIEEAKAWLSNKVKLLWIEDYKSDVADFVNWHAKSVYFYDPAGNIVELIARFDLKNEMDEPFDSKQFLSISEVGLVFKQNEFEQGVSNLLSNYSLPYFRKQPPLPQFRAIGSDEGLFIVVAEHRDWYPTKKPCRIFPIHLDFENETKEYKLNLK